MNNLLTQLKTTKDVKKNYKLMMNVNFDGFNWTFKISSEIVINSGLLYNGGGDTMILL